MLLVSLFLVGALVVVTQRQPVEEAPEEVPVVYDEPAARIVPIYTQTDERWGELPYADADVATSGCGHIVLLVGVDDGVVTIHDPCEMYAVTIAEGEFEAVAWEYFVSIGRSS